MPDGKKYEFTIEGHGFDTESMSPWEIKRTTQTVGLSNGKDPTVYNCVYAYLLQRFKEKYPDKVSPSLAIEIWRTVPTYLEGLTFFEVKEVE